MTYLHDSNEEIQSYINNLLAIDQLVDTTLLDQDSLSDKSALLDKHLVLDNTVENIAAEQEGVHAEAKPAAAFIKHIEVLQQKKQAIIARQEDIPFDSKPVWGRSDFNCVSFNISGLKLAVAKEFILDMQPLNLVKTLDCVGSKYFLGSMDLGVDDQDAGLAKVIDTAQMVMPERYKIEMRENYRYVLRLKDCAWCLAVDSVGGDFTLSPQKVRWRSEHTRREWLAGTIIDKMCALIDVDALNRQFMATIVLDD